MKISVISSSLDACSKSRKLAECCKDILLSHNISVELHDLKVMNLPKFDNASIYVSSQYVELHQALDKSDGLVLCSPVYNWSICAELKSFIESMGSTPPDGSRKGALFDKVITFVNSGGLPHSYMAFTSLATSLMLDFKCIINPYNVYTYDKHWTDDGALTPDASGRLLKSMKVGIELTRLLMKRNYRSDWEI